MSREPLRYDRMVENALRGVVREALTEVQEDGLPGEHHFYVTFRTDGAGVKIPDYLREQYPGDMTIVLQYQFYGLEVTAQGFCVTLSFGGVHERLVIPFAAITGFADPSVNFGLKFQGTEDGAAGEDETTEEEMAADDDTPAEESRTGTVVALDAFRKK
ncbi:SspB family protein [Rhodocista pekingensis]|uniref:SspB family protein n=1 Tax=Rhodocista pekingensis TaxID=201185 RepID=A0ABW2KVV1_9PROT